MSLTTEQEKFWSGDFGTSYVSRNQGQELIRANTLMFAKILPYLASVETILEFGSNIGLNLMAIKQLLPTAELSAIEINDKAVQELQKWGKVKKVYHQSILEFVPDYQRDFVFTKVVLIHINPEMLPKVYDLLYQSSKKYIMVCEYYHPVPVEVSYRGHSERLFKRDFAGELLDRHPDLELVTYGFFYQRDSAFNGDDVNWFLLRKP